MTEEEALKRTEGMTDWTEVRDRFGLYSEELSAFLRQNIEPRTQFTHIYEAPPLEFVSTGQETIRWAGTQNFEDWD